jgi:hypothetical protein
MSDSFTFKLSLSVTSEKLKKTFHLPHELVNGDPYINLLRKNTVLGRLTGQVRGVKYFQDVNVFNYLQERRNDMVTDLLMKAMTDADIGADVEAQSVPMGAERIQLFNKHQIEPVLSMKIPAFKSKLHEEKARTMNVLATPKMAASVSIEATEDNMKWFVAACSYQWPLKDLGLSAKRKFFGDALPDLVKVRNVTDKKICLYINYKKDANLWGKHCVSIQRDRFADSDELNTEIQTSINRMQEFYANNHVGDKDDHDPVDAAVNHDPGNGAEDDHDPDAEGSER